MPRIDLRLPPELHDDLMRHKPKTLSLPQFCGFLLEQHVGGLDRAVTLGAPSEAGAPSTSYSSSLEVSIPKSKNKGRSKGSLTLREYPEAFEAFWRAYQSLPVKAAKQSKPLALAAWEEALVHHPAEDLQRAVEALLGVQERELRAERGFTVAMPDCFRWLRDECYLALLEQHEPAQPSKPSWML